jgi:hypothetical protein
MEKVNRTKKVRVVFIKKIEIQTLIEQLTGRHQRYRSK